MAVPEGSDLRKLPIYFGYAHCVLNAAIIGLTIHGVIWWNFLSYPTYNIPLHFCQRDLVNCQQRCAGTFAEG